MFGMLPSRGCHLALAERRQWQGYMCGVCLALRNRFGHAARLATNTDAALIALLHHSLEESHKEEVQHFCPLRKPFTGTVPDPNRVGLRYSSVLALLMAATKVLDRVDDGEVRSRPARCAAGWAANRWLRAAEAEAAALAFDVSPILENVHCQAALESGPPAEFGVYARPTEQAVGAAFRHLAPLTQREEKSEALFEIGRGYGRMMYLLDSVQDYERDIYAGRFNPLAAIWRTDKGPEQIRSVFRDTQRMLKEQLDQLGVRRSALVYKLLLRQLTCNGNRILGAYLGAEPVLACGTGGLVLAYGGPGDPLGGGPDEVWPDEDEGADPESRRVRAGLCEACSYQTCDCDGSGCNCCDGDGGCCGCDCNCCDGDASCCGCDCDCDGCDCDCGS